MLVSKKRREESLELLGFGIEESGGGRVNGGAGGDKKVDVKVREKMAVVESAGGRRRERGAAGEVVVDEREELMGVGEGFSEGEATVGVERLVAIRWKNGAAEEGVGGGVASGGRGDWCGGRWRRRRRGDLRGGEGEDGEEEESEEGGVHDGVFFFLRTSKELVDHWKRYRIRGGIY